MQIEAAVVQGRAAFHTAASEVDVNKGNNDWFPWEHRKQDSDI